MTVNFIFLALVAGLFVQPESPGHVDFSRATILLAPSSGDLERKAATVLREEIQRRTGLQMEVSDEWSDDFRSRIILGRRQSVQELASRHGLAFQPGEPQEAEGFELAVFDGSRPSVVIAGTDPRGVLYGVGRLLRKAKWGSGAFTVPRDLQVAKTPRYPIRGHQLGNRDVNHTYDAWTLAQFKQYIRDLALFGANSIELIPPETADYITTRSLRKVLANEVMNRLCEIIDS